MRRNTFSQMLATWLILGIMLSAASAQQSDTPPPAAAGACYCAALGEALDAAGERIEANSAYDRAYSHAISDSVSAGRFAAQIALRQADLLLRMNETAKAEHLLRQAVRRADPAAWPHPYFWGAFRLTRGRVPSL